MKALLLAAGFGTRLRPITLKTPKCLVKVGGISLLDHWLANLEAASIEDVRINTHYLADVVETYLEATQFNGQIECVYESRLLGTAGTLLRHIDFCDDEGLLVIHADNFCEHSLSDLVQAHAERPDECSITALAFRTTQPSTCGIFEINSSSVAIGFHEKISDPPGNLASCAVTIFDCSALEKIKTNPNASDIAAEILPRFLGKTFVVETQKYFADVGTPQSLELANNHVNCN